MYKEKIGKWVWKLDNKEILNNLEKIISKEKIKQNEPMKEHTSLKIGGPAEFFVKVNSVEELIEKINHFENTDDIYFEVTEEEE